MEKIATFLICDSIENIPKGNGMLPIVNAPQLVLRPMFVPGVISFAIVLGIKGMDLNKNNKINVQICTPNGEALQNIENNLPVTPKTDSLPDEYNGCMMFVDIRNMVVMNDGDYLVNISVNDNVIGQEVIPVYKREM